MLTYTLHPTYPCTLRRSRCPARARLHGLRHGATALQRVSSDRRGTLHSSCAVESSNEFQLRSIARSTSYTRRPRRTQVHTLANAQRCATSRARAPVQAARPRHRTLSARLLRALRRLPLRPRRRSSSTTRRACAATTTRGSPGRAQRVGLRANAHGVRSTDRNRCALSALRGRVLRLTLRTHLAAAAW